MAGAGTNYMAISTSPANAPPTPIISFASGIKSRIFGSLVRMKARKIMRDWSNPDSHLLPKTNPVTRTVRRMKERVGALVYDASTFVAAKNRDGAKLREKAIEIASSIGRSAGHTAEEFLGDNPFDFPDLPSIPDGFKIDLGIDGLVDSFDGIMKKSMLVAVVILIGGGLLVSLLIIGAIIYLVVRSR